MIFPFLVPEHAPHRLWADPISAGQLSLVWTPLLNWEWNGNGPLAYMLQYRALSLANVERMKMDDIPTEVEEVEIPRNGDGNGTESAWTALFADIKWVGERRHKVQYEHSEVTHCE